MVNLMFLIVSITMLMIEMMTPLKERKDFGNGNLGWKSLSKHLGSRECVRDLFIYLFICLFVYLFICLFVYLFICLFVYFCIYQECGN